ncbi:MAG: sodium/proline symporter PutP [Clostridia bacterium]|nr:sodium/proline symporter PutP [Clostridia bacterium]
MRIGELLAFIVYFVAMLGIGIYFMVKSKSNNEKEYFLGERKMGPFVTAMSAQASDMSGWLLMGLPGSILAIGFGEVWIAIGLALGTYFNWLVVAGRLRKFSQSAGDSITIPQYLNNRFKASGKALQVISAVIFFVCFTVYVASGFKAGAALFQSVLQIESNALAMVIFGVIMLAYTFMGGFNAVCWTDFFQSLLMLGAIVFVPIFVAVNGINGSGAFDINAILSNSPNYFNLLPSGKLDWESISSILSGLAWGLGYMGMPHILVRFMSIKSSKMIKTSRRVATVWVVITLAMAALIGVVGRFVFPELVSGNSEMVFINMVRIIFPAFISGIFLSAILAAAMSTADSQLLVASSAFTCDIYKPIIRKNATEKETLWVGRAVVVVISIIAFIIAIIPGSGNIMSLVENAWAGFGAAFGPVIILSLYWKKFTYKGAVAGMVAGGLTVVLWIIFLSNTTGLYELLPGFIVGMVACIVGSLLDKADNSKAEKVYEEAVKFEE